MDSAQGLLRISAAARLVGMHPDTLRRAADEGRLPAARGAEGWHERRFRLEDVLAFAGVPSEAGAAPERVEAHYVRVSGAGQRASLTEQAEVLAASATGSVFAVYRDVGSGLNDHRRGLERMMDDAAAGRFTVVRAVYADRLTRFGLRYVERYFTACGVSVEFVDDKRFKSSHEELVDDLLSLVASFSGKFYKMRSLDNRRKVVAELSDRLEAAGGPGGADENLAAGAPGSA
jgi:excisionase family DNA binding protein